MRMMKLAVDHQNICAQNLALLKKRDLLVGYHILDAIDTLEKLISEYRLNGKYALNSILQLEMTVGTEKVN